MFTFHVLPLHSKNKVKIFPLLNKLLNIVVIALFCTKGCDETQEHLNLVEYVYSAAKFRIVFRLAQQYQILTQMAGFSIN